MQGKITALRIMLLLMATTMPGVLFAQEKQGATKSNRPKPYINERTSQPNTQGSAIKNEIPRNDSATTTTSPTSTSRPSTNESPVKKDSSSSNLSSSESQTQNESQSTTSKIPQIQSTKKDTQTKSQPEKEDTNPPAPPNYQDPQFGKPCRTCDDLLSAYLLALEYDPTLQAAKATQLAAREALPQARAQMLPVVSGTATFNSNKWTLPGVGFYNSTIYSVTLDQPILHFEQWANYYKAANVVKQANAIYCAAEQDLMIRTAEAYFNVLKAVDGLYYAESQEKAFAKFQDQTEQRFKVGLIPITDSEIAKARHDNAVALVISAKAAVEDSFDKLREIIFVRPCKLAPLKEEIPLLSPQPNNIKEWVRVSLHQNFTLQAAGFAAEAAKDNIRQNNFGHLPTIDLHGEIDNNSSIPNFQPKNRLGTIGTRVTIPFLQGGLVLSQTREARYNFEKAESDYLFQYLSVESNTRQNYRGVITQINQIKALKQALRSNQSALSATEAAFNVGTRTIVDVLNAQTDLIRAQRDYSDARNNYVLETLRLKQSAGTLSPSDLAQINTWLKCLP